MKTKQFQSEFHASIPVNIIGKDDYRYDVLKVVFNQYGFGFMLPNDNLIVIDGEAGLSKAELKWVEAHEVAHYILRHSQTNPNDEIEADTLAYKLLIGNGYHKAAQLVKNKFKERHGIEFK
jgi:Zn-dependent peptidase ImmA (M78 family)